MVSERFLSLLLLLKSCGTFSTESIDLQSTMSNNKPLSYGMSFFFIFYGDLEISLMSRPSKSGSGSSSITSDSRYSSINDRRGSELFL